MPLIKIKGAGVILRDSGDRILLVLGKKHDKWSFPKGHVDEDDKTGEDCAARETKEETGLVVEIPTGSSYWVHNKCIYYIIGPDCVTGGWRLCPEDKHEVAYAKWLTMEELCALKNGNSAVRRFAASKNIKARR
jgi:8-oxo-dGTP pyrophosphatase MutT (NUDIX family)